MDRIEHNSITLHYDEGNWSLPLRFDLLRTANWTSEMRASFRHEGPEVSFNRLFIFRHGGCRVTMEGRTFRLTSGRLYLLPIDVPFVVSYPKGCEIFAFHFQLATSTGRDVLRGCRAVLTANDETLAREIMAGVEEPSIGGMLRWQLGLFRAACLFAEPLLGPIFEQEKQARDFKELLEYIQAQPPQALSIAHLARRMGTTRAALSRRFARVMGFPLKQCLMQTAMRKAEALVVRQDLTVKQIAHQLGYEDPFYFHRVFKRHTGMTPLEYRKRARLYR